MTRCVRLSVLPVPSTDIDEVVLLDRRGTVTLRYTLLGGPDGPAPDGPDGPALDGPGRFVFDGVRAYRRRAESHCTSEHLEAYDTLVRVSESPWVEELRGSMPVDLRTAFAMHHYMIYIDSFGCYEVVARSWAHHEAQVPDEV